MGRTRRYESGRRLSNGRRRDRAKLSRRVCLSTSDSFSLRRHRSRSPSFSFQPHSTYRESLNWTGSFDTFDESQTRISNDISSSYFDATSPQSSRFRIYSQAFSSDAENELNVIVRSIASASSFVFPGSTSMTGVRSSAKSNKHPVRVATTLTWADSASKPIKPNGSFRDGD